MTFTAARIDRPIDRPFAAPGIATDRARGLFRWNAWLALLHGLGERTYMLLSLFAKSALAWQVFAGTLRP